jgi:hypothetical protein
MLPANLVADITANEHDVVLAAVAANERHVNLRAHSLLRFPAFSFSNAPAAAQS